MLARPRVDTGRIVAKYLIRLTTHILVYRLISSDGHRDIEILQRQVVRVSARLKSYYTHSEQRLDDMATATFSFVAHTPHV